MSIVAHTGERCVFLHPAPAFVINSIIQSNNLMETVNNLGIAFSISQEDAKGCVLKVFEKLLNYLEDDVTGKRRSGFNIENSKDILKKSTEILCPIVYFKLAKPWLKQNDEKISEQAEEIQRLKEIIANKTFNASEQDSEKSFDTVEEVDLSILTEEEILILTEVLDNKLLKTIAAEMKIGESVIKKKVPGIYKKLGISRKNLFQLYQAKKLVFPK